MILVGNQRDNSKDMADHLLKSENETVIVHEVSGFMGDDLHSAFQESFAWSKSTKAKDHLYSLSLNPTKYADVSDNQFLETIARAEKRLGLMGQPRAVVFHYKRDDEGNLRKHAHCVWSRITEDMKAVNIAFDHRKLERLSLQLFKENDWEIPRGFLNKKDRDPLNYSHAEAQQANRANKKAPHIKKTFQDAWAQSDSKDSFAAALLEQGYVLARGNQRGFVAIDNQGEVYAVARYAGIKTKDVRARLGEPKNLPSVEEATVLASKLESLPQEFEREKSEIERRLIKNPQSVLEMITDKNSVFTQKDVARHLSAHIKDTDEFDAAYAAVLASQEIVSLAPDPEKPKAAPRFSTREIIGLERSLLNDAQKMAANKRFVVASNHIEQAIQNQNADMQAEIGVSLSAEQEKAIRHMTNDEQLSCVIGYAGAGKSTILNAAREAWEKSGHRVFGAALAGKAAEGLQQSSGIQSRRLASYELSWENGVNQLQEGDVLVVDEAGMIGSRQMSRFINEAQDKGAKIVLVGDAEQLQPIEAGAPFRSMTERIKPAHLHEVHRQKQAWQKQASIDFASGETKKALEAYRVDDCIDVCKTNDEAVQELVTDYLHDFWVSEARASQIALAHRKADVRNINQLIRDVRKDADELKEGHTFETVHGKREFAAGDRFLFTRNDRELGVKNGMLGTVIRTTKDKIAIELDDKLPNGERDIRTVTPRDYGDFDHGYATTIHKSQGCTVSKSYVLASRTMDRHLTYVAMSRHKVAVKLYTSTDEFSSYSRMVGSMSHVRHKQSTTDYEVLEKSQTQETASEDRIGLKEKLKEIWHRITGIEAKDKQPTVETNVISENQRVREQQAQMLENHRSTIKSEQQERVSYTHVHDDDAKRISHLDEDLGFDVDYDDAIHNHDFGGMDFER